MGHSYIIPADTAASCIDFITEQVKDFAVGMEIQAERTQIMSDSRGFLTAGPKTRSARERNVT